MKQIFQFLLSACLLLFGASGSLCAQTARLYHNGSNEAIDFTGADALAEAIANANEWDEIILSAGTFNGCDVNHHQMKIYGVGAEGSETTVINDLTVTESNCWLTGLRLSGVTNLQHHAFFQKCHFDNVVVNNGWGGHSGFWNCKFDQLDFMSSNDYYFLNCIICNIKNDNYSHWYENSVIIDSNLYWGNWRFEQCVLYNCSLYEGEESNTKDCFHTQVIVKQCVALTDKETDMFQYHHGQGNVQLPLSAVSDIFTDFNGSNASTATFQLTADAQSRYTDALGRTIGIHAGNYPYSMQVEAPSRLESSIEVLKVEDGFADIHVKIDVTKK